MKLFVIIFALAITLSQALPGRKRDIGLKLRQQQQAARQLPELPTLPGGASNDVPQDPTESTNDHTAIYGNGIHGHEAEVEHYEFNKDDYGNYNFAYKQTDLQQREETGTVVKDPETGEHQLDTVVGSYEYIRPDGKKQRVEYTADKDGFRPNVIVTDA